VSAFAGLPDQPYAARLLDAALEQPAHAYLLSGPAGSGKRRYADRFATAILKAEPGRVERRTHPDLFVLEPEGQGILVEGARRLRRDLHLRPYEAARRVYLILDAHLLRDESANALLKSLEEPPAYGVFVLVSDHAGRMLPTILSRVQTVTFRPFPVAELERAVSDPVAARAALGNLARAEELAGDPATAARRRAYLDLARASASDDAFDSAAAAAAVLASTGERSRAESARVGAEATERLASVDDPKERRALERRFEERAKRAGRRAEWDELRLAVDTVGSWYRDLMAVGLGAGDTVVNSDVAGEMSPAAAGAPGHAARALEVVTDVRRSLELNIHPGLGLEAMFHRLYQAR
jgi:DNA polymerase III subunit delta'